MTQTAKLTGKMMIEVKLNTIRVCEAPAPVCGSPSALFAMWNTHVPSTSWYDSSREHLVTFTLDTRHRCTGFFLVSIGTCNTTIAHPRDILRPAVMAGAYGFVLAHNHPSGDSSPSDADRAITRRIREAADILNVNFLDHVIIGSANMLTDGTDRGFFSFREHGLL